MHRQTLETQKCLEVFELAYLFIELVPHVENSNFTFLMYILNYQQSIFDSSYRLCTHLSSKGADIFKVIFLFISYFIFLLQVRFEIYFLFCQSICSAQLPKRAFALLLFYFNLHFYISYQAHDPAAYWSRQVVLLLSTTGLGLNIIELYCYTIFFGHVYYHDNNVAISVVRHDVVRQRNRTNAISMAGLFATWLMELAYFCWLVYFLSQSSFEEYREALTIVKMAEFVVVPTVQVITSPSLRRYVFNL